MKISTEASKEIRSFALKHASGYGYAAAPIVMVDGNSKPKWKGSSYCHTNKSGAIIHYPNAYRKTYGKPIYVASTRHIEVGQKWVMQLEIDLIQVRLSKVRQRFVGSELAEFAFYFDLAGLVE